jgi:hypothetical protein
MRKRGRRNEAARIGRALFEQANQRETREDLDAERERESGRPVDDMNVVKMSHFSGLKKSGPT